jgi:hypothetical protein
MPAVAGVCMQPKFLRTFSSPTTFFINRKERDERKEKFMYEEIIKQKL